MPTRITVDHYGVKIQLTKKKVLTHVERCLSHFSSRLYQKFRPLEPNERSASLGAMCIWERDLK